MLEIRRALRAEPTRAEDVLWQHIRNSKLNGLRFKRQHSIGNYVVDFYCASKRLVIEVDGGIHNIRDQREKDRLRDINLTEMGFHILRVTNDQVLFDIEKVILLISK